MIIKINGKKKIEAKKKLAHSQGVHTCSSAAGLSSGKKINAKKKIDEKKNVRIHTASHLQFGRGVEQRVDEEDVPGLGEVQAVSP